MPPLAGFSDNPLLTRDDVIRAANTLLKPLHRYKSPLGARIKIPIDTGTQFDETAAQLEGFARPLWVVACLLSKDVAPSDEEEELQLKTWPMGLKSGTDPNLEGEYWGDVADIDQRMVEMEIISFALLTAPTAFWPSVKQNSTLSDQFKVDSQRQAIIRWLQAINGKNISQNNWLWFRVLTNLALVKTCGVPLSSLTEVIGTDLQILDQFEREGNSGWSSDGYWNENGRQADYYSGSFAVQYSQLLFVAFGSDIDPKRADRYRDRAAQFAIDFMGYFSDEGIITLCI